MQAECLRRREATAPAAAKPARASMERAALERAARAALSARLHYQPRTKSRRRAGRRGTHVRQGWIGRVSKYSVDSNCSFPGGRALPARSAGAGYARRIATWMGALVSAFSLPSFLLLLPASSL